MLLGGSHLMSSTHSFPVDDVDDSTAAGFCGTPGSSEVHREYKN
jgi:hypothetical protein